MFKNMFSKMTSAMPCLIVTLLLLLASTPAVYATTWNLAEDFSSSNPNGAWSYGWEATLGEGLTLYDNYWSDGGVMQWQDNDIIDTYWIPSIWKNMASGTSYGVDTGDVSLHPGASCEYSVARWTATEDGTITVTFTFGSGDGYTDDSGYASGSMSYYILYNGTVYSGYEWTDQEGSRSGTFTITVAAGATIDFIVGANTSGDYFCGNTPLDVTITSAAAVPEPATMLLLGLGLMGLAGIGRRSKDNPVLLRKRPDRQ